MMSAYSEQNASGAWSLSGPTDPRKCVVLNCLPIDRADFVRDFYAWPAYDFVRGISGDRSPEEAWQANGFDLAQSLVTFLDAAGACGVSTIPAATRADFVAAFSERYSVIIVLAHWKGARLTGRDILVEPNDLVASMAELQDHNTQSQARGALLCRCRTALRDVLCLSDPAERREYFASRLNDLIIQEASALPGLLTLETERNLIVGDIWLEAWHRNALDAFAKSQIVVGNQIEMRDGLQNPSDVVKQIPTSWEGLVDLTMCQSVIFGHLIKAGRSGRGILTRRKAVDPILALAILRRLIIDIGTERYNYTTRYLEMFRETSKIIQDVYNASHR